jgi:hypothetical protein
VTYDKAQGKTLQYVILCLHKNSGFSASLAKMFVGFTRVTDSKFLRVWPALDEDLNLERFLTEKHDLALVLFDQAYDINGNFQDSLYMLAYQRHLDAQIISDGLRVQSNRSIAITTDNIASGISAIGLTTTSTLSTSRIPSTSSRNTSIVPNERVVKTVTTPVGRLIRPILDKLKTMTTFSWAYVPFLKAGFASGELNLRNASLMILEMFWPSESNIYSSLKIFREAYEEISSNIVCNLREQIYNK